MMTSKVEKILFTLALMFCMSAFFVPMTAFASVGDTQPPTLEAELTGGILHVEAQDEDSGVEAVYANGSRFDYPASDGLDINLKNHAITTEQITLYAVDFAGNKSDTVQIENPNLSVSRNPFTPAGTGTVVDNATDGDEKEFYTIETPDGNVFYLIIDRQRDNQNVYFLNAVTESDLLSLAKTGNGKTITGPTKPEVTPPVEPTPKPSEQPKQENQGDTGTIIFVVLAVLIAGGAGYYFKIYRPKQQAPDEFDEDEIEFEDDTPLVNEDEMNEAADEVQEDEDEQP